MLRTSRELSSRVEITVHTHPNRMRRGMWWLSLGVAACATLWLWWQQVLGEHHIYEAGPMTTPHRLLENDCARCHTQWTPLERLVSLNDGLHSIENTKCETCHRVSGHHDNQVPAHREISCAACHQEHEGSEMLLRPSNRHCLACHNDLKTTVGPTDTFAKHVSRFDESNGHPEFAWKRLAEHGDENSGIGEKHQVRQVLEHFQRFGETAARWQDRGRIRFNHAAHLKAEYDASGQLVFGVIGKDRKFTDLSRSCESCHEPDHERRFMKPISFDRHCKECHPLLFDNDRFPGQAVPHRAPDIVRGFLTELYTLRALRGDPTADSGKSETDKSPPRPIPGHRDFQKLTKPQATEVLDEVAKAEALAQQHRHGSFGYEASGSCRYCHQVEPIAANADAKSTLANWRIVPPNLPERWLLHGEFHHESHRLLSCTACHADVGQSQSTGDVLIPSINICRACHSENPAVWSNALPNLLSPPSEGGARAGNSGAPALTSSLNDLLSAARFGARSDCIECHRYHDPLKEKLNGALGGK